MAAVPTWVVCLRYVVLAIVLTNTAAKCTKKCPKAPRPVCGSDGKTYKNQCKLDNRRCYDSSLYRVNDGECRACKRTCGRTYEPVCGSDGVTYDNLCELDNSACDNAMVSLQANGECPKEVIVVELEINLVALGVTTGASDVTFELIATTARGSQSVNGRDLWKLGIYGCRYEDGWCDKIGHIPQILSKAQASTPLVGGRQMVIQDIQVHFDVSIIGCDDLPFICAEFGKATTPRPGFTLTMGFFDTAISCWRLDCRQVPATDPPVVTQPCRYECPESGHVVCGSDDQTYNTECALDNERRCGQDPDSYLLTRKHYGPCRTGVIIDSMFWSAQAKEAPASTGNTLIEVEVLVLSNATGESISGRNLWRVGFYGSQFADGSGPRLGFIQQMLDSSQASTTLAAGRAIVLNAEAPFDITAVGCSRYKFTCLEFTKGDSAQPPFPFHGNAGPEDASVFMSCKQVPCVEEPEPQFPDDGRKRAVIGQLAWGLRAGGLRPDGLYDVTLNLNAQIMPTSDYIAGRNLLRVGLFGSQNQDGSGPRLGFQRQTLTRGDASRALAPSSNLVIDDIQTKFPVTELGCSDYGFLCLELAKGDGANPDFIIISESTDTSSTEDAVILCKDIPCRNPDGGQTGEGGGDGTDVKTARFVAFKWRLSVEHFNSPDPSDLTIHVVGTPHQLSDAITGDDLWRVGLYASDDSDPLGAKYRYQPQVLSQEQQAIPLSPGDPLDIPGINARFNIDGLGCGPLNFICIEFTKGTSPKPDFQVPLPHEDNDGVTQRFSSCKPWPCQDPDGDSGTGHGNGGTEGPGGGTGGHGGGAGGHGGGAGGHGGGTGGHGGGTEGHGGGTGGHGGGPGGHGDGPGGQGGGMGGHGGGPGGHGGGMGGDGGGPGGHGGGMGGHEGGPGGHSGGMGGHEGGPGGQGGGMGGHGGGPGGHGGGPGGHGGGPGGHGGGPGGQDGGPGGQGGGPGGHGGGPEGHGGGMGGQDGRYPPEPGADTPFVAFKNLNWNRRNTPSAPDGTSIVNIVFTLTPHESSDPIEGYNLWKVGMFGSDVSDNTGARFDERTDVLSTSDRSRPLLQGIPLVFNITTPFKMGGIGCGNYPYLCMEFTRDKFSWPAFRLALGQADSIVSCQLVTCNPNAGHGGNPNRGHGGTVDPRLPTASFHNISWTAVPGHTLEGVPTDLSVHIMIFPKSYSDTIKGRRLWRLGLFGNTYRDGTGADRIGYVSQILTPKQAKKQLNPGSPLEFNVDTQFLLHDFGCDLHRYLCIEFAQHDQPQPRFNFPVENSAHVSCRPYLCQDPPRPEQSPNQRVASIESFNWHMLPSEINLEGPTSLRIFVDVLPDVQTDVINGENLWKIGIYGSRNQRGGEPFEERLDYDPQLLQVQDARRTLAPTRPLNFDVHTEFDMWRLGCGPYKYLCVEFGKDHLADPDFEVALAGSDLGVRCQRIPCHPTRGTSDTDHTGGQPDHTGGQPDHTGGQPDSDPIKIAGFTHVDWRVLTPTVYSDGQSDLHILVELTPHPDSDDIVGSKGSGFWRVGIFANRDEQGTHAQKLNYDRQILSHEDRDQNLLPPDPLNFDITVQFDLRRANCESEFPFLCLEIAKGERAHPAFNLPLPDGALTFVTCQRSPCLPTNQEGGHVDSGHGGDTGHGHLPVVTVTTVNIGGININPDSRNDLEVDTIVYMSPDSPAIRGTNLWRLEMWGSSMPDGSGPRIAAVDQVLPTELADRNFVPPEPLFFPTVPFTLDMRGRECWEVTHICAAFSKLETSNPEFELEASPDAGVLTVCQQVECYEPRNPQIAVTGLSLFHSADATVYAGRSNRMHLGVRVNYDEPDSVGFEGTDLWGLKLWLSPKPNGKGKKLAAVKQSLSYEQAGQPLVVGRALEFEGITFNARLTGKKCKDGRYVCATLYKNTRASTSYVLIAKPNQKKLTKCIPVNCI